MTTPKTLVTPEEIVAACEEAKAAGDETFASVFSIEPSGRASDNGAVQYFTLICRAGGKEDKLLLRFKNERFVGRMYPQNSADEGFTRDPTRAPSLGIQKCPGLAADAVPSDPPEAQSAYFQAVDCVDTWFPAAVAELLSSGTLDRKPPESGLPRSFEP